MLAAAAALWSGLPVCAAVTSADELRRLTEAQRLADERFSVGDVAGCRAILLEVRAIAWQASTRSSVEWPFNMAQCQFWTNEPPRADEAPRDIYRWGNQALREGVTPAEVNALFDPWLRKLVQRKDEFAGEDQMRFFIAYRQSLNSFGMREQGDEVMQQAVRERLNAATATPPLPSAEAGLMHLAQALYGSWELHFYTRQLYEEFDRALGPAHPVTLVTLRALAYGERFHGRAQSAVRYADLAVTLVNQHQPGNERLRIGLMAERSACLAAAGRLADALADGMWVRDRLLARDPLPLEGLVRMNYNLAGIALEMGDYPTSIGYADASIDYARRTGIANMLVEARVPGAIREVARLMIGERGAAQALQTAIEPTRVGEMHIGPMAFALVRHAAESGDQALLDWAVDFMNLHIERYRTPFHSDRAVQPLMKAWQAAGFGLQHAEVREPLDLALSISLTGRSLGTEALTHFSLARHLAATQPDEAILLYKRGANALQQLRTGLPGGEADLHRAWLASHEADLRAFIGLLIDRGRLVEAEQAVLFLRDEEIVDYTRRARGKRSAAIQSLPYTGSEADRSARFDALAQRVKQAAASADQRADAWRTIRTKNWYRDDEAAADAAAFQREVHQLLQPMPEPAAGPPRPRGAPTTTLPRGLARVTYFVRAEGVDAVVQQGRVFRSRTVVIARDELNRRVQAMRVAMGAPQRDARAPSRALYDTLIAPLADLLKGAGISQLQIVPDASLRYVPFAALHDGQRWLAQRYALSTDLSGSALHGSAPGTSQGVLAFGRSTGDAEHAALPGVERELSGVTSERGAVAINDAFTAASLRSGLERQPAVVHIASHFELSPAGEEKSYLLLGDGQRLSLADLRQLPWGGVQLALLSACDSAVTVEAGHGRELVGFATALLGAGVRNVVASLWRVSDGATAEWMKSFYGGQASRPHERRPLLSPQILAQTQRRWLRDHEGSPLAHPHYWAAFSWIGPP
jgi:CHAT domain-containing protein